MSVTISPTVARKSDPHISTEVYIFLWSKYVLTDSWVNNTDAGIKSSQTIRRGIFYNDNYDGVPHFKSLQYIWIGTANIPHIPVSFLRIKILFILTRGFDTLCYTLGELACRSSVSTNVWPLVIFKTRGLCSICGISNGLLLPVSLIWSQILNYWYDYTQSYWSTLKQWVLWLLMHALIYGKLF